MRKTMLTGIAVAAAVALYGGSPLAVDQFLSGKKLIITNPASGATDNKIVYLSKDASLVAPSDSASDPSCFIPGNSGGALVVNSPTTGEGFSIPLPCDGWTHGPSTFYKYKDSSGTTCKVVIINEGILQKAVCKGSQVSYALGVDQVSIDVKVRTGSAPRQWCTSFNATSAGCTIAKNGSDGKKYLAKNCTSAPATCPASPSGAFIEVAGLF